MVVNATLLSSWTLGAWCSLLRVALKDIYILLVSSGMIQDVNTWSRA